MGGEIEGVGEIEGEGGGGMRPILNFFNNQTIRKAAGIIGDPIKGHLEPS